MSQWIYSIKYVTDWFQIQEELTTPFEGMPAEQLNKCLQKFYVQLSALENETAVFITRSSNRSSGSFGLALEKSSIVMANHFLLLEAASLTSLSKSLYNFLEPWVKVAKVAPIVRKQPLTALISTSLMSTMRSAAFSKSYEDSLRTTLNDFSPREGCPTLWQLYA